MSVIAFRVDASLLIGVGHVMRCLTLADALRMRGVRAIFLCRPHQGHLLELIAQRGYQTLVLPELKDGVILNTNSTGHANWLGTDWTADVQDTKLLLNVHMGKAPVDWLVLDHYALDANWEKALRPHAKRIMVIDDLADRSHECDILLDQNFGRLRADYTSLVPEGCQLLCGSQYALLRPEFKVMREYSLKRRFQPVLRELLITMGGVDKDNVTGAVLRALRTCNLPKDCRVTVVMGQSAPWLEEVQELASGLPQPQRVLVGVSDMARLMADSDLVIGAAGTTSWERCCLGLPSIIIAVAENQFKVAKSLEQVGAAILCLSGASLPSQLESILVMLHSESKKILLMSKAASKITDGNGVNSVLKLLGV